jgi:hypothetical protein
VVDGLLKICDQCRVIGDCRLCPIHGVTGEMPDTIPEPEPEPELLDAMWYAERAFHRWDRTEQDFKRAVAQMLREHLGMG